MMEYKLVIGAWVQAIGSFINAIDPAFVEDDGKEIAKVGNILQAAGSALVADVETNPESKLANKVQAIGNLVVTTGLYRENANLEIKGNLIQAAGGGLALLPSIAEKDLISFKGDFLQVIGNSMQAISGIKEQTEHIDASLLDEAGAWAQAVGALLSAIHQTKRMTSISR